MTYTVTVTHEDDWWLASVDGLPGAHTEAQTLAALDASAREVIVLAADLPDEAMAKLEIVNRFESPLLARAARIAVRRRRLEGAQQRIVEETATVARELVAAGYSTRDAATVLGLTSGRISQIAGRAAGRATAA